MTIAVFQPQKVQPSFTAVAGRTEISDKVWISLNRQTVCVTRNGATTILQERPLTPNDLQDLIEVLTQAGLVAADFQRYFETYSRQT